MCASLAGAVAAAPRKWHSSKSSLKDR
jgi:hypothetical protein